MTVASALPSWRNAAERRRAIEHVLLQELVVRPLEGRFPRDECEDEDAETVERGKTLLRQALKVSLHCALPLKPTQLRFKSTRHHCGKPYSGHRPTLSVFVLPSYRPHVSDFPYRSISAMISEQGTAHSRLAG